MKKLLTLTLLLISVVTFAQIAAKKTDYGVGYMEYIPQGYDTAKTYPTIIFLHGSGERGTGSPTDLEKLKVNGPLKWMKSNTQFIILCPQTIAWCWRTTKTNTDGTKTVTNDANEFTKWALINYKTIDPKRVYGTGLSMGGEGIWFAAADDPGLYTAIAPVCGRASRTDGSKIAGAGVRIWAFHGDDDTAIPIEGDLNAILGARATNRSIVDVTFYERVGHNCWDRAYRVDNIYHSKNMYQWFLMYSKP